MKTVRLGRTGLEVSELCLGAMAFGGSTPPDEAAHVLDLFADAGGNFVDTAVNYSSGASEEVLGRLLAGRRDRFVLGTKYTAPLVPGDHSSGGNHAKSLLLSLETSLRRLGTDYIDLYWVHVWDGATPLEQLVQRLDDAVRAGKILHVGISNAPAWVVARAVTLSEARNLERFAAIQVEYNLVERTVERELIPMSGELDLSVLAWGPLAGGLLTGKYVEGGEGGRLDVNHRRLNERNLAVARELVGASAELDASPAAVALAWLRARRAAPIPVMGARTASQLEQLLACVDLRLPAEVVERLDSVSAVTMGYPHELLARLRRDPD
jgi:aryl-alcohol dehydrogenase-like predicted oxidoreductase